MQWLKENLQYDKHIPHETQKGKGIYSTIQAEITEIDSLYPAVFKKVLGAYSGLIYIFVNNYDVEGRWAFLHASPKAETGLGVQSLRPSVRPS